MRRRAPAARLAVARSARPVVVAVVVAACLFVGCSSGFDEPMVLGGRTVAPETLNRGAALYRQYCVACHGEDGTGKSSATVRMRPAPRDFTTGQFKFKSVKKKGDLPTDADLLWTVRHGLEGTEMNRFDGLTDDDARAVVQFVKTFSERWRTEGPGEPIEVGTDPWAAVGAEAGTEGDGGRMAAAIERGRAVYHGVAACWQCHPSYLPRTEVAALVNARAEAAADAGHPVALREDLGAARVVETAWGPERAPDFRDHRFRVGRDSEALYRVIAAGVGGTPMPAWHEKLSATDLWAVVHYVREIQRVKRAPLSRAD